MNLPDRLISWAQNEEMIDSDFLAHGRDCLEAAEVLRDRGGRHWFPYVLFITVLAVTILAETALVSNQRDHIIALRTENTQFKARICAEKPMETPLIFRRDRKVTG